MGLSRVTIVIHIYLEHTVDVECISNFQIMFNGDASGRKINLSGSGGRAMDKSAFIEKQRKDRGDRERSRRFTDAAFLVQRRVRGWMASRRTKRYLCDLLVKLVTDVQRAVLNEQLKRVILTKVLIENRGCDNILTICFGLDRTTGSTIPTTQYIDVVAGWTADILTTTEIIDTRTDICVRLASLVRLLLKSRSAAPMISRLMNVAVASRNAHRIVSMLRSDLVGLFGVINFASAEHLIESLRITGSSPLISATVVALLHSKSFPPRKLISPTIWDEVSDFKTDSFPDYDTVALNLARQFPLLSSESDIPQRLVSWLSHCASQLSIAGRETVQSEIVKQLLAGHARLVPTDLILQFVQVETLSEDTLFQIATHSAIVQVLADEIIVLIRASAQNVYSRIYAFTALFSKVVPGLSTGRNRILSSGTIETLFPALNLFAFKTIVRGAPLAPSCFQLVKAVHDRKHVFPSLAREDVWTVAESIQYIPAQVNSLDLIDREANMDEMEDSIPVFASEQQKSIFESIVELMPHAIPFPHRVRIFAAALAEDQQRQAQQSWALRTPWTERVRRVRREYLVEDGLAVFEQTEKIKQVVRIEFVNPEGNVESGIDGGGLFKEFMHKWTLQLMNPEFGLCRQLGNGRITPSVDAWVAHPDAGRLFRAAGRAVGKALYEMVLLETHLGEAFLSRVLGKPLNLEQLEELDDSLYRNLIFVNECENVEDLALTMSVTAGGDLGKAREIELVPGGRDIAVTSSNKLRYVLLAAWFYLSSQLDRPASAFAAGLSDVIPLSWLRMFSPQEINLMISGELRKGFDISELRANIVYGGGYSESSATILLLWELLAEFSDEDRSAFLAFVTSSPRPPLLGFRVLHPKFAINRVPERDRLPTSSTCANLLKLPDYGDKKLLREKLQAAIYSGSGFDLS